MRWDELDTSEEDDCGCWIYRPSRHKTEEHMCLEIILGPKCVTALKNFHDMAPLADSSFVFSTRVLRSWKQLQYDVPDNHTAGCKAVAAALEAGVTNSRELTALIPKGCPTLNNVFRRLKTYGYKISTKKTRARITHVCNEGFTWNREEHTTLYTLNAVGVIPEKRDVTWSSEYEHQTKVGKASDRFSNERFNTELHALIEKVNLAGGWWDTVSDPLGRNNEPVQKRVVHFTPHKLRHYYTALLARKHGFAATAAVTGHMTKEMLKLYSGLVQDVNLAKKIQSEH